MEPATPAPAERTRSAVGLRNWLLWFLLICATSSTVVTPTQFFNTISDYVLREESAFRWFALFWGAWWFVIVKSWHAIEFAILFWLTARLFQQFSRILAAVVAPLALLLVVGLAVFDEWRQTFVPERGGTWIDVGIDSAGATVAAFLWELRRLRGLIRPPTTAERSPPGG